MRFVPASRLALSLLVVPVALGGGVGAASEARREPVAAEARFVRDGVLVSPARPRIAIAPADSFAFVGSHPFRIRDVAAGERFVFVDATDRKVERLFLVQFESFLPGIEDHFRYDLSRSPVVAGYPFRSNGFAFDLVAARESNPENESSLTADLLEGKGFSLPGQWMMWRSLTVPDPERKSEMILFYVEDVAATGSTLDDLYEGDRDTDRWRDLQKALENRANGSFRLAELGDGGAPDGDSWAALPARPLRGFEPFLGKTWKALVDAERDLYDVARWERALAGQAVRIVHSVDDGVYGGETLVTWDRDREELVYTYFTTAGFYTRGAMRFDDEGRLVSRETVEGHEAGITEVESTQELLSDGTLRVTTRMLRDGAWEDRSEVVYREDPRARVLLPD